MPETLTPQPATSAAAPPPNAHAAAVDAMLDTHDFATSAEHPFTPGGNGSYDAARHDSVNGSVNGASLLNGAAITASTQGVPAQPTAMPSALPPALPTAPAFQQTATSSTTLSSTLSTASSGATRALLYTSGGKDALFAPLGTPPYLLPIGDRTAIEWALRWLARAGIREVHIAVEETPVQLEELLGDGSRMELRLHYHWLRSNMPPIKVWKRVPPIEGEEWVMLAHCAAIPPLTSLPPASCFCDTQGSPHVWAHVRREWLDAWAREADPCSAEVMLRGFLGFGLMQRMAVPKVLGLTSVREWMQSNVALIEGKVLGHLPGWKQTRPGVFIGPFAKVALSARLIAPVAIGPNVRIGSNCVIGPGTVVLGHSRVGDNTGLAGCVVLPYTHVGSNQTFKAKAAVGAVIVDVENKAHFKLPRDYLIRDSASLHNVGVPWVDRLLALALLLLLWPLAQLYFATLGRHRYRRVARRYGWYPSPDGNRFALYRLVSAVPSGYAGGRHGNSLSSQNPSSRTSTATSASSSTAVTSSANAAGTSANNASQRSGERSGKPSQTGQSIAPDNSRSPTWSDMVSRAERGFVSVLLGHFALALPQVLLGRVALVGVKPRNAEEWELMASFWRELLSHRQPGLIAEPAGGGSSLAGYLPEVAASERFGSMDRLRLLTWYLTRGYRQDLPPSMS